MSLHGEILLVEDHADTSAALVEILTKRGHSVLTADNGRRALDLLQQGVRPRLIVVDLLLPELSGWNLLEYLSDHEELRKTPTIVITAVPKDQVRVLATAVFSKPLDYLSLTTTIDFLVASPA